MASIYQSVFVCTQEKEEMSLHTSLIRLHAPTDTHEHYTRDAPAPTWWEGRQLYCSLIRQLYCISNRPSLRAQSRNILWVLVSQSWETRTLGATNRHLDVLVPKQKHFVGSFIPVGWAIDPTQSLQLCTMLALAMGPVVQSCSIRVSWLLQNSCPLL